VYRYSEAVQSWLLAAEGGQLYHRLLCLAWQNRSKSPLIVVTTSAQSGEDGPARLTVRPRSEWEAQDNQDETAFLRTWFSRPGFCADDGFLLRTELEHPGDPADRVLDMLFRPDMNAMVSRERARAFGAANGMEAVRAELKAWYFSAPDLREKFQRIAWERRLDKPVIVITTSPSSFDALDPTVTVMPL
jgi:hypothetical protein